jgi:hypothetical protein
MANVWSRYRLSLTDHSIEEIRTILRRLSQTAEGAPVPAVLPPACVRMGLPSNQFLRR